jgi:hypothetical protein
MLGCNTAIAHTFIVSLAFNGLFNGTTPERILFVPQPPPVLRAAGTFGSPTRRQRTVGVVTVTSEMRARPNFARGEEHAASWIVAEARTRWLAFCSTHGHGYDATRKPPVIYKWHSEPLIQGPLMRLRQAQIWLPYHQ